MSDLDDLEDIAESTRFRTSNTTDNKRMRAKRFRGPPGRDDVEYITYSTAKPTLPKLKFMGEK